MLAPETADGFLIAKDRKAHGLIGIDDRLQMIEHDIVRRIARATKLLQHDMAFALQLSDIERRMCENVGQNVERERHIGLQHARMKSGLLAACVGIEETTDGLDLFGDADCRAPLRALERHVFEHVAHAHDGPRLVPRTAGDIDADEGAFQLRHWISYDHQAVGKSRNLYIHTQVSLCSINARRRDWSLGRMLTRSTPS